MQHHSQHSREQRSGKESFRSRKGSGWGMNLYRNTRQGKIAGVAAGLADYWDIAPWVVRLTWVGAFLFTSTLALWAYLAAWILLSPRPGRRSNDSGPDESERRQKADMEYDEYSHAYRPRNVFRYSGSSSERLAYARERLDKALRRVEGMERYVTSSQYELNRKFSQL